MFPWWGLAPSLAGFTSTPKWSPCTWLCTSPPNNQCRLYSAAGRSFLRMSLFKNPSKFLHPCRMRSILLEVASKTPYLLTPSDSSGLMNHQGTFPSWTPDIDIDEPPHPALDMFNAGPSTHTGWRPHTLLAFEAWSSPVPLSEHSSVHYIHLPPTQTLGLPLNLARGPELKSSTPMAPLMERHITLCHFYVSIRQCPG